MHGELFVRQIARGMHGAFDQVASEKLTVCVHVCVCGLGAELSRALHVMHAPIARS
jgi:hypothetical protein